jgi:DNA mismatch endonuclease (patch repair protein)
MSSIKGRNTLLEKEVFVFLRNKGLDFKTHYSTLIGRPDIVFPKKKKVIFIDSDFWHGWQYPKWRSKLTTDFWIQKIDANRKRDIKINRILKRKGWKVLRVWEHNLSRKREDSFKKIIKFLK